MKGKFSFHRLLHNNKLMILVSVIAAVAIWASVVYGTSTSDVQTVTVAANMDMSNSFAGIKGMKNFTSTTQAVDVPIKGSRWVVASVTSSDIKVTPDFGNILGPGLSNVRLDVSKNSDKDFEVLSTYKPQSVSVFCDYPLTKSLTITPDISGIAVKDTASLSLGTPVISATGLQDNTVTVDGPQTYVSQIASIVAKVDKPDTISENQTFSASLVALDSNGEEVNTQYCSFSGLEGNKVNVIVPVNVHRTVNFSLNSLTYKNMPDAYRNSKLITITPASIELIGTKDQVENYASSLEKEGAVGTIDFTSLNPVDTVKTISLNIPQGIREKDNVTALTVSFAIQNFSTTKFDLPLTSANTHLSAVTGATATLQVLPDVTLVGPNDSIAKIKPSDLSVSVDAASYTKSGSYEVPVTIQIANYSDVWVYYSDPNPSGYSVYVTIP